jgi:hypothetical protein
MSERRVTIDELQHSRGIELPERVVAMLTQLS